MRVDAAEVRLDLRLGEMHRRRDDVRRQFVAKLDDVFAEIGFDRRNAIGFEIFVDGDFLADHRLALGHGLGAELAAQIEHDRRGRPAPSPHSGRLPPCAMTPLSRRLRDKDRDVPSVWFLMSRARVAQRLELGQLVGDFLAVAR